MNGSHEHCDAREDVHEDQEPNSMHLPEAGIYLGYSGLVTAASYHPQENQEQQKQKNVFFHHRSPFVR